MELGVAEEGGGSKRRRRTRSGKREREHQGRGESSRESERGRAVRDDAGAFTHASRGSAASRRRRGASRAHALSRLCLLAEVRDDWQGPAGLGRLAGPQVRPGKCSAFLFSVCSVFYFFEVCFEFGFQTNQILCF